MAIRRLLIANRGEIAIRIARAAAALGIHTVGVHAADEPDGLHAGRVDRAVALAASGPAAYLDAAGLVRVAREQGCDAVHPGYGFLSEDAGFARACRDAGLCFVGPAPATLETFGDKTRARALAGSLGVPVARGTDGPVTRESLRAFLRNELAQGGIGVMVKAVAGGGGRGMRPVYRPEDLDGAIDQCAAESLRAFGNAALYAETLLPGCRHIEVQLAGDGRDLAVLGERDCSLQRGRQKLVEVAPVPHIAPQTLAALRSHARALATATALEGLGTFEFLVSAGGGVFVEANPRLQVEHTVTEEVLGLDLVRLQLLLAGGSLLAETGLDPDAVPAPRGYAIQLRINAERLGPDGRVRPSGGVLLAFDPPGGPGVRCDTHGYGGLEVRTAYDSLLAKLVVHERSGDFAAALGRARRTLGEFRIEGVDTNAALLAALLERPEPARGEVHTTFVEDHLAALLDAAAARATSPLPASRPAPRTGAARAPAARHEPTPGTVAVVSPLHGTLVAWEVAAGDRVQAGQCLGLVEAMKMQHPLVATGPGRLRALLVTAGATVAEGECVAELDGDASGEGPSAEVATEDPDFIRPDLAEVLARRMKPLDAARPDAVARRRAGGARTARENIEDLCDPGSFQEYGGLGIAAQRARRSLQDLIDRTPADGMVVGTGRINGDRFPDAVARCMVLAYDYTVLAGTQGTVNHHKKDRMFELAARHRWPVVVFAEGGGGRPGDIDTTHAGSLHIPAFTRFAQLSGKVPLVAIVSGRCFAGNAVLAGCCDVIIATRNVSLGMGGPAMIEGGGLGVFHPDEVGPVRVQQPNGVIDIVVEDEAGAVRVARRYLSYFQGVLAHWRCADQRRLRSMVPANRLRAYDVRPVLHTLADEDSVLELRPAFAPNLVTALARIEGRPVGVIANDPMHLGGAIDAPAADKAARFLQLCDAFGLPVVSLCDTPGNMVGPEAERTALVRHCCRLYVVGANLGVPIISVVLRKAYGLGAQAMVGGSFHRPVLSVAWPTGEFGPMNLEGAVRLGYRKELEAIADPAERAAVFERMVAEAYARGQALNAATLFEIDDVIDPAHTRERIVEALRSLPPAEVVGSAGRRPWVDTW